LGWRKRLHPEYRAILAYLTAQQIKTSITSNSGQYSELSDDEVKTFS